jgi:hypothetical protein
MYVKPPQSRICLQKTIGYTGGDGLLSTVFTHLSMSVFLPENREKCKVLFLTGNPPGAFPDRPGARKTARPFVPGQG